jgi:phosphoserine/homoserine phosphotransferase
MYMDSRPPLIAMDLEGVFIPEIWIAVAERTGIAALRRTTRDEPDYDKLMGERIAILREHGLALADIQRVIASLEPLPGAVEFLNWLRERAPLVILSDTFYEFAAPLLPALGRPTIFCNSLTIADGRIAGYRLRQPDGKRKAVEGFQALGFRVFAAGDSYNDTTMIAAADAGALFCPPANVVSEFPHFPVTKEYSQLQELARAFFTIVNYP